MADENDAPDGRGPEGHGDGSQGEPAGKANGMHREPPGEGNGMHREPPGEGNGMHREPPGEGNSMPSEPPGDDNGMSREPVKSDDGYYDEPMPGGGGFWGDQDGGAGVMLDDDRGSDGDFGLEPVHDYTKEELLTLWERFFTDTDYSPHIEGVADQYPDLRSIYIDYWKIDLFDNEFALYILEAPDRCIHMAEVAVRNLLPPDNKCPIHVRLNNLPKESARVEIRHLRANHMDTMLAIDGLVRKAVEVRPRLETGLFQCSMCEAVMRVEQDGKTIQEPMECSKDAEVYIGEPGCGRPLGKTRFKLLQKESVFIDTQKIEVQEAPEGLRGGAQPERLTVYLEDDLVGSIYPGDRVILNGTLRAAPRQTGQAQKTLFDIFLYVNSIELEAHAYEEVQISDEEEAQIEGLAKDPRVYDLITQSIAPSIYGLDTEKSALMLQLFGGVTKTMRDETRIRGDIHILMVGDPGTAKSQLLRYISNLAPRGIYASGKSASAAGLCVAPDTLISLSSGELVEIGPFTESRMNSPELVQDGIWRQSTNGHKTVTVDTNYRIREQNLQAVWRLRSPRKLYEIISRTNRKILVSPETPLPVNGRDGGLEWTKAVDLKAGMYLATPRKLPEPKNRVPFTIELIDDDCIVEGAGGLVSDVVERLKVKYGTKRSVARHFGLNENKLYHHWIGDDNRGNPTLGDLLKLGSEVGVSHAEIAPHVKMLSQFHGHRITIPERITPELCYFAGLVAGDGSISKTPYGGFAIRFCNSDPGLIDRYRALCRKLFGTSPGLSVGTPSRPPDVRFHSKIIARILERMGVPQSPKSARIDIGCVVQKLPNTHLASFLMGLFDCDGSCNCREGGGSSSLELYTTSEKLVKKAQILLMRFGIISKVRKRKNAGNVTHIAHSGKSIESNYDVFVLSIYGKKNLTRFEQHIGFGHTKKRDALRNALNSVENHHSNWDTVPHTGRIFKEIRESYGIPRSKIGRVERFERGSFDPTRDYLREILGKLQRMIDDNAYWGRKVVLPARLRDGIARRLRARTTARELAFQLGVSEYRAFELVLREKRCPPIPAVILGRLHAVLEDMGEKDLAGELAECPGFRDFGEDLRKAGEKLARLQDLATSDVFWDRIVEVRAVDPGLEYIYDLTVDGTHNFVANGLLAHNTAAAVKDEFGEGRWTLEAGALVLADQGIACVDELDKMTTNDRSSMHEAMEQQTIHVAKAGITATLQSRCSILAAANPKLGRFDTYVSIFQQIDLDPPLMSRFDLIFSITDTPDKDRDTEMARNILRSHRAGEISMQREYEAGSSFTLDDEEAAHEMHKPPLKVELLRKYVAHAKRSVFPVMTEEALKTIMDYYVDLRKQGQERGTISITARQLEAFVRLAEASARIRLSGEATVDDAKRAIRLVDYYLRKVAGTEGGFIDYDKISTGITASQRDVIKCIHNIIRNGVESEPDGMSLDQVYAIAETENNIERDKTRDILQKLIRDGTIYAPKHNVVKPVNPT